MQEEARGDGEERVAGQQEDVVRRVQNEEYAERADGVLAVGVEEVVLEEVQELVGVVLVEEEQKQHHHQDRRDHRQKHKVFLFHTNY